jgi:hypothetical protein
MRKYNSSILMPRQFGMAVWQENVIRRRDIIEELPESLKPPTELFREVDI